MNDTTHNTVEWIVAGLIGLALVAADRDNDPPPEEPDPEVVYVYEEPTP